MTVYDHLEPADLVDQWSKSSVLPSWVPAFVRRSPQLQQYEYRARNVVRHIGYQARGMCSGVHGLFHQCLCSLSGFRWDTNLIQVPY